MKENDPSEQAARQEPGQRAAVSPPSARDSGLQKPMGTTVRVVLTIKKAVPAGKGKISDRNVLSEQAARQERDLRAAVLPPSARDSEHMGGVLRSRKVRRGLFGKTPGRDSHLKRVRRFRRTGAVRLENRA